MSKKGDSSTQAMVATLATIVGSGTAMSLGSSYGTAELAWDVLKVVFLGFLPIGIFTMMKTNRQEKSLSTKREAYRARLRALTSQFNTAVTELELKYKQKTSSLFGRFNEANNEYLRFHYEQQYKTMRERYNHDCKELVAAYHRHMPLAAKASTQWTMLFVTGLIIQLSACGFSMGAISEEQPVSVGTAPLSSQQTHYWNAENIPMPHLTDGSRYVSNPDHVVTDNTERQLNAKLKRLDDSLQIESAMILVNHIENDDPFRLAQDVGNKYGVGKSDRGLIIVLGYLDHSINISPGRSLEADLTDVECYRLQQNYVIPAMKAELPDSGMLYLTDAIYQLLLQKDLPVLNISDKGEEPIEDPILLAFLYVLLMSGWCLFGFTVRQRYRIDSGLSVLANPFALSTVYASSGGFGGGFFGGGGGSFNSGGFGGGSFGGGGATSRW